MKKKKKKKKKTKTKTKTKPKNFRTAVAVADLLNSMQEEAEELTDREVRVCLERMKSQCIERAKIVRVWRKRRERC